MTKQTLAVRPLNGDDAARLSAFFRALSPDALSLFTPHSISPEALERICRETVDMTHTARLAAVSDDRIVGYGILDELYRPVPILSLGILDAYAGCGIGKMLLNAMLDWARSRDYVLACAAVPPRNVRAHRLLQHDGFYQVGNAMNGDMLFMYNLVPQSAESLTCWEPVAISYTARSGKPYMLRSLREDDGAKLDAFFHSMSPASIAFFTPHRLDRASLDTLCRDTQHDPMDDRFVAVWTVDGEERVIGYVFLRLLDEVVTSVGIGVADEAQGEGIGRVMLTFLKSRARTHGKHVLRLITHSTNYKAQKLYKTCGFEQYGTATNGELLMFCPL
ncbi:MAG: GNAT family N-acetyltransferase [Clostridiaceae bacterium]|nr:GNAT family N-acetyltransferase [Clostridiaceae bacterium]